MAHKKDHSHLWLASGHRSICLGHLIFCFLLRYVVTYFCNLFLLQPKGKDLFTFQYILTKKNRERQFYGFALLYKI